MTELLTAAQMKAIETAAIESGRVTGLELMERAGRGVVEAVFEEWPELQAAPHRAVVLCGPGNNGGDGFVVARLLKEWGWEVEVFLYGDPAKLPPDAKVNHERWVAIGAVLPLEECFSDRWFSHPVVIDALFGTGLSRSIPGLMSDVLAATGNCRRVAVDLPSGLCSDSGRVIGEELKMVGSHLTVSFHAEKLGHRLGNGPDFCKKTVVKDIGIERRFGLTAAGYLEAGERRKTKNRGGVVELLSRIQFSTEEYGWAPLVKEADDHKYTHGHALILSGGAGRTGAARLAARGALRIGAGLVTLGVPGSAQMEVASQVTAVMLRRAGEPDELAGVLEDERLNAVCLGPGLGVRRARELVEVAVRAKHTPYVVLDADALTAFGGAPEALFALLHEGCVLTPHAGEFKRLFPDIAEKLAAPATQGPAYSKVDATRAAAKRAGCVVLFKGPDTVIAAPDGRCSINSAHYERSAPWLATAGSGDVLAGFITGLLAREFEPMAAAATAAWLHVECALRFGPGLIAEDIPEEIPSVFRSLRL